MSPKGSSRHRTDLEVEGYNEEKNRQLLIILIIIASVFSASTLILVAYMIIFPSRIDDESDENGRLKTSQAEPTKV